MLFKKNSDSRKVNVNTATENIVPTKQMYRVIDNVFTDLSNMIAHTLGPAGGNTLITEAYASTPIYPTKDGFTVMNNHIYTDVTYESIYRIVRDTSARMNEYLGDSTTSVVIIAAAFYKCIRKYLAKHKMITPYGIKHILDSILKSLDNLFKEEGYIINISDLPKNEQVEIYRKVATIAANNDSDIGDTIAKAFEQSKSDYTYIDIQKAMDSETKIDTDIGFEMPYGYSLPFMANAADGLTAEYEKPLFLLIDGMLSAKSLDQIKQFFRWTIEENQPLVIIAEGFAKEVMDYIVLCRTGITRTVNGQRVLVKYPILTIGFNMSSNYGVGQLQDLEAILGAKALKTNSGHLVVTPSNATEFYMLLGRADHIESKYAYTRIRGGGGDMKGRIARIEEIKHMLDKAQDAALHGIVYKNQLEHMKHRIAMLEGEMMIIHVGGDSYKEKNNRKLIFDDAYLAVKACRSNGISLGGNVGIYNCCKVFKNRIIEDVVKDLSSGVKNLVVLTSDKELRNIIGDVIDVIAETSLAAFKEVFNNATNNRKFKKKVFKTIKEGNGNLGSFSYEKIDNPDAKIDKNAPKVIKKAYVRYESRVKTYNIISNKFESFTFDKEMVWSDPTKENADIVKDSIDVKSIPSLIVPGNTDVEILRTVFSIVGLFLTSNQLITLLVDKTGSIAQKAI